MDSRRSTYQKHKNENIRGLWRHALGIAIVLGGVYNARDEFAFIQACIAAAVLGAAPIAGRFASPEVWSITAIITSVAGSAWMLMMGMGWLPLPDGTIVLVKHGPFSALPAVSALCSKMQLSLWWQVVLHTVDTAAAAAMFMAMGIQVR
jgi:hypothetical protein